MSVHQPVLVQEVIDYLKPQPNQNIVDCTFGAGGHSGRLLELIKPRGKVLAIEWDPQAVQANTLKSSRLILVNDNYKHLNKIVHDARFSPIHAVLLDLGLSSDQLIQNRGFSYQDQEFLDLRFNPASDQPTAHEVINTYTQQQLVEILKNGDEPLARPIAKKIIANRQQGKTIETAAMLVQLVSELYRLRFKTPSKHHPATRVFQALRMHVNAELKNLSLVLPQALEVLESGGRLAVISFHSGEDRLVKHFFKQESAASQPRIEIITKKPVTAGPVEIKSNPRSRSAKLRVVQKI